MQFVALLTWEFHNGGQRIWKSNSFEFAVFGAVR